MPALHVLTIIAACLTVASIGYCVFCICRGITFAQGSPDPPQNDNESPPISVLKPLKGADPEMYEALRSHCTQEGSNYEVLFGVSDAEDPAVEIVRKLIAEFPQRKIKLLICAQRIGSNGKVGTLAQLVPHASHELLLVNDGDIRVPADYLRRIIGELTQPNVGMVTCLYRGVPADTIASKLEGLSISTDFVPGVLAARTIEGGLHFGLGSTLAFRRSDLEKIGGFEMIADYLADDFELGRRIAGLGHRVELSSAVVETHLPAYNFRAFIAHQLRWARTIRTSRPGGYIGLPLTFTLPWAVATLLLARGVAWAWILMAAALVARFAMAFVNSRLVLREKQSALWLMPLRDFAGAALWLVGVFGNRVIWRGETFFVKNGKLARAPTN